MWARQTLAGEIVNAQDALYISLLGTTSDFGVEYGADLIGATVMRLRGELEFEPASAATAVGAAGVIVESANFGDSATSALDGPFTSMHNDWMAYEPLIWNDNDPTRQVPRWEVDVKSNRKFEELGQDLYLVVENSIVGVAVTVRGVLSIGLKLP